MFLCYFKKMASDQISGASNAHTLSEAQEQLKNFWKKTMDDIKNLKPVS